MSVLSERLKGLREQNELSQKEVALSLKIKPTAFSNYETGEREPNIDIINKFAQYYKVSVDYLTGNSDYKNPTLETYIIEKCSTGDVIGTRAIINTVDKILESFKHYCEKTSVTDELISIRHTFFSEDSYFAKMIRIYEIIIKTHEYLLDFNSKTDISNSDHLNYSVEKENFISDINIQLRTLAMQIDMGYTNKFPKFPKGTHLHGFTPDEKTKVLLSLQTLAQSRDFSVDGKYMKDEE